MADTWDDVWWWVASDASKWRSLSRQRRSKATHERPATPTYPRKQRAKEQFKRLPANPDEPVGSRARWTFDPSLSPWWKLMRRPGVRIQGTRAYDKFRRTDTPPAVRM